MMKKYLLFGITFGFSFFVFASSPFELPKGYADTTKTVNVHFINVGQGDATLIQCSNGNNVLIDFGSRGGKPKAGIEKAVEYIKNTVDKIDVLVVSHGDADQENQINTG